MAWRYKGPKGFVSRGVYSRYRHLSTYSRVSDAKWNAGKGKQSSRTQRTTKTSGTKVSGSSQSPLSKIPPSTPGEWERMMETRLKKLSKRKRSEFYQEEYDGPEYETGVDY